MKRTFLCFLAAGMFLGSSITSYAAPKDMGNGIIFDAEYYAQNNADVVAAYGTKEKELFRHYTEFGRNEGRKAYQGDPGAKAAPVTSVPVASATVNAIPANRSKLAKSSKSADNDAVAAGSKLVLPLGAEKQSGTTSSGLYWESSWYLHYNCAWTDIYNAYSGIKFYLDDFRDGLILSECFNFNMAADGVQMYLDFGFFTEYVDQLKARNVIPQSYQLPATFYTITSTGGKYQEGVYKMPYITTDCPEAMALYNGHMNFRYGTNNKPDKAPDSYTPKYIRDQQAAQPK